MRHHVVENPLHEVVKRADVKCMEDVGLRGVVHNTGNMFTPAESMVNLVSQERGMGRLDVSITAGSM